DVRSEDPLNFFDLRPYAERLAEAELKTGLGEAMLIGQARIDSTGCELSVMDFSFMGGSMGSAVGEKFSRACDGAAERGVTLVSVSASGGARMQEGILALMQLPKTVAAVEDLKDAGGALISVIAHPTTGGLPRRRPTRTSGAPSSSHATRTGRTRSTTWSGCSTTGSSCTATAGAPTTTRSSPVSDSSTDERSGSSASRRGATSRTGSTAT